MAWGGGSHGSSPFGSASVAVGLRGSAAGSSTATASIVGTALIAGTAAGTSTVDGALGAVVLLSGSAAGTSTVTGKLLQPAQPLAGVVHILRVSKVTHFTR